MSMSDLTFRFLLSLALAALLVAAIFWLTRSRSRVGRVDSASLIRGLRDRLDSARGSGPFSGKKKK